MKLLFLPIDIDFPDLDFKIESGNDSDWGRHTIWWKSKILTEQQARNQNLGKIIDQLPFDKITFIKYNYQMRDVGHHIDLVDKLNIPELSHIRENEPAGYRLVFSGHTDTLEVYDTVSWRKAVIPSVPGCYLIDSTVALHRVLNDTGRTGMYFRGILNTQKHKELIDKSLKKYKDHAIYSAASNM